MKRKKNRMLISALICICMAASAPCAFAETEGVQDGMQGEEDITETEMIQEAVSADENNIDSAETENTVYKNEEEQTPKSDTKKTNTEEPQNSDTEKVSEPEISFLDTKKNRLR